MDQVPQRRATDYPEGTPWYIQMLVSEWKQAWKWLSVQLAAVLAAVPMLYEYVPTVQQYIDDHLFRHIMSALAILTIVARLANQPAPAVPPEKKEPQ